MSNLEYVITFQKYFESLALNIIPYKNCNTVNNANFDPFQPNVPLHYIETSHLICFKNIMTCFYIECNTRLRLVSTNYLTYTEQKMKFSITENIFQ